VDRYNRNLLTAFRELQSEGYLEIMTCCATHGFLPLMNVHREAVRAQIFVAVNNYRKHMGRDPRGIWLAECGYYPGDDEVLRQAGIRFFFVDSHGLILARPRPKYALYSAVYCPSGVAAFARDPESSRQVWSSKEGYPGDLDYREFYRDVGYDLPMDYIAPYIHESGIRINTGVKYYRITGTTDQKEPYNEEKAIGKTKSHARHFVNCRLAQAENLREIMGRPPIITCPYDAELYGHWWYEGPDFLKAVFETIAEERMIELANTHRTPGSGAEGDLTRRALNQAARELLLAQSSDWAFIIKTATCVEYAEKRTKEHLVDFTQLYEEIKNGAVTVPFLEALEGKNNIFSEIDYTVYCTPE